MAARIKAHHQCSIALDAATLRARIGAWPEPAFLGGDRSSGPADHWSILAACPRLTFESTTGHDWRIETDAGIELADGPALIALGSLLDRFDLGGLDTNGSDEPSPFVGGLIGFLSYDLAPLIESIPRRLLADSAVPVLRFGLYDTFVLIDHATGEARLHAVDLLEEGEQAVADRLEGWVARLHEPVPARRPRIGLRPVAADQARAEYTAAVQQVQEYLRAGDIFQANLSQRFTASGRVDPLTLATQLQRTSPAPYSAYLQWGDLAIVSASPELFYETRGRRIVTRPIKGTRPRSSDPATDQGLVADLLASPKDQAELAMIVDLERNDLGRVCEYGSVRVTSPRAVESYPNVHHTVATVEGRLRSDASPIDVVRAMFPGGSITGAPKIRAMEIIDALEPCRRGIYTGAIGYWSAHGRSAFNIAIRTLVVERERITYHVGGGIVADSVPEQEFQETLDKGRSLLATLDHFGTSP